jgi:phospholipid transport system substrate-binding protein
VTRKLAACLLAGLAAAPFAARAQAADGDPKANIAGLDAALLTAMKTGSAPFPSRYQALAPAVDRAFNLRQVLQTVVGLRWSSIPADQQQKLLGVFRAYTIANYAANFDSGSGNQIRILPEIRNVGADRVVETEIVPASGDPTRLDYVMRQFPADDNGGGWQAIDVLETGTISQVAVQRSDFRSLLSGGAADLIASLQKKVDALSGGTIRP